MGLPIRARVGVMIIKGYSEFPKFPEPHHQMPFSAINSTFGG